MRFHSPIVLLVAVVASVLTSEPAIADDLRVAVATNFADAAGVLTEQFERSTGHRVTLSFGSTGKHYAQIRNGAPFDAFLAADLRRPALLESEGLVVPGSRFTYAVGRLVLWAPTAAGVDPAGEVLRRGTFRYLAIANPGLAPYGLAAREVLEALGLWNRLSRRIVRGENIGQAFAFVRSGNADLGFVAWSQVKRSGEGSWWVPPQSLYTPIEQQAVLLKDGEAARALLAFFRSEQARRVLREYGYDAPSTEPPLAGSR